MSQLSGLLKRQMEELAIPIDELANQINKSVRTVQYYLEGRVMPKEETLEELSRILKFDLKEIYESMGERKLHEDEYKEKYIRLLETQIKNMQYLYDQILGEIKIMRMEHSKILSNLNELKSNQVYNMALNQGLQEFWAEVLPLEGYTAEQALDLLHQKQQAALQKHLQGDNPKAGGR